MVTSDDINRIADMGTFTLDVNPRQVTPPGVGLSGFEGGGAYCAGQSADQLDMLLNRLLPTAFLADEGYVDDFALSLTEDGLNIIADGTSDNLAFDTGTGHTGDPMTFITEDGDYIECDGVMTGSVVWPNARISMDVSTGVVGDFRPCTVADVFSLREAFLSRYGPGKPNPYGGGTDMFPR